MIWYLSQGFPTGGTQATLRCMRYIVVLSDEVGLLQQFALELAKICGQHFHTKFFHTKFSVLSKLLLSISPLLCELNGACDETITLYCVHCGLCSC